MDGIAAEWVCAYVTPIGRVQIESDQPWARVWRVPIQGGVAWFKVCAPVQAFEPRLTTELFERWPDRVAEVIAHDAERRWLLLADAGTPLRALGNPPEAWLDLLPRYAELQRSEAAHVTEHLRDGVPDLRVATLPARYDDLLGRDLPLDDDAALRLSRFAPRFAHLCELLAATGVPPSVQHDDLHAANLYVDRHRVRVLDWGDASISHPFASLVATFRFLEETNRLRPDDAWFARLRDAYLEVWGPDLAEVFALAMRVGSIAHAIAWMRQRDALPEHTRPAFDHAFTTILERAVQQTLE
ncbi:MAG: hypothetical protein QOI08_691 [Actinomycetota bacterium]|nr:hypothetical protein [Actinomycetota bacterium]